MGRNVWILVVVVVVIVVYAGEVKGQSKLVRRDGRGTPSAGDPAATVRREAPADGDDRQLVEDARHAVRVAGLVIEGTVEKLCFPSPRAEVSVSATLKGSAASERVTVDLAKAALGRWPKPGQHAILCLARSNSGNYELAGFHAGILPITEYARKSIAAWLVGTRPTAQKPSPAPYARQTEESETILTGELSDVRPAADERSAALGAFEVRASLLGYGGYRGPITVRFPASEGRAEIPRAGRYLLFLKGSLMNGSFIAIDTVRLGDLEVETKVSKHVSATLGSRKGVFTTIQATLAEWQDSWNARDIDRCMRCYSVWNLLRRQYEAGGEARLTLGHQLKRFSGKVRLIIERIKMAPARAGEGDSNRGRSPSEIADVTVQIALSSGDLLERRKATMKFTREGGEWLILREGF